MRRSAGHRGAPYHFIAYAMILVASIGLDQVTKLLVRTHFQVGESKSLIDGLLSLTYVMNRGAAFGVLSGQYRFLVCFPLLVSVGILVAAMFMKLPEISRITMVFIAAGGLSNALDRIFLGYVTDMIAVSFFPPVFNVADMYVTVGCVCLALSILFSSDKANRKEAQP